MDMKLEVVVVPVSDVDRAKQFSKGWGGGRTPISSATTSFRIVQLTPPGSAASIQFGVGLTAAPPGSLRGAYLVVEDIEAARRPALAERGAPISEVFHEARWGRGSCPSRPPGEKQVRGRAEDLRVVPVVRRPGRNGWMAGDARTVPAGRRSRGTTSMNTDYDVIVLGGGAPGEHCAAALAAGGVRVAIVERDLLGGECSYWGCIPSKTLLRPGEAVAGARNAPGAGKRSREPSTCKPRWPGATSWCRTTTTPGRRRGLADAGIEVVRGRGALAGRGTVVVEGTSYTAEHIVVATGSDPAIPPVPGLRDLPGLWTDREVTGLTEVPARLLVLGGGPIGVEMAQAITRLGASVTIVERSDHLLPREPRALGDGVAAALRGDGVVLRLGSAPTAAPRTAPSTSSSSPTGRRPAVTASWSRRGGVPGWRASGSRRSASRPIPVASPSTRGCRPDRGSGRSVTSPGCGSSPTSASTRAEWWRPTSSGGRAKRATRRSRA